jgi:hypothetical protein
MAHIIGSRSTSDEGVVVVTDAKGAKAMKTLPCPHCGLPFIIIPGSGTLRHFCRECSKPTCNGAKCHTHSPFEKRLEMVESGKLDLRFL